MQFKVVIGLTGFPAVVAETWAGSPQAALEKVVENMDKAALSNQTVEFVFIKPMGQDHAGH